VACSGEVGDYDVATPKEQVFAYIESCTTKPNWVERTLSGHWRLVWLFERPLRFPSHSFAVFFQEKFSEFAFDPSGILPGFDGPAWKAPERMWTNSGEWYHIHDTPIPASVTTGWLVKASEKFNFDQRDFGARIPVEELREPLAKKYPRFAEWPGDFVLGAQGPTFWVEASKSPKSAIVRETGMQTFSANAPQAFYRWEQLLDSDFVRNFEANYIGKAVEGIYADGKSYWWKNPEGAWCWNDATRTSRHLRVDLGLSDKTRKGDDHSDYEKAMAFIDANQRVNSVAPMLFSPDGLLTIPGGQRVLNICTTKVIAPASEPGVWGPEGNFSWVSWVWDELFDAASEHMRAYVARFYKSGYFLKPESGPALILAGERLSGKTLFTTKILSMLMGGGKDARRFLTGKENFGGELFSVPVWTIDDGSIGGDPQSHRVYSERLKAAVANEDQEYHMKFGIPANVKWCGRPCVTLNDDPESMRMLPDSTLSNLDKLVLIRVTNRLCGKFPRSREEIHNILVKELPFLARYLLDYQTPAHLIGDSRMGVACYHDETLKSYARQASPSAAFSEILEDFLANYFRLSPAAEYWEGTSYQLQKQITADPTAVTAMRNYSITGIRRALEQLSSTGRKVTFSEDGDSRVWRIHR
jgi:hypothetical protein